MTQQSLIEVGGKPFVKNEWFLARITSVGSSVGSGSCSAIPHAWVEQRVCNNGYAYQNVEADSRGEFGTISTAPAFRMDGGQAKVGDIVLMRARGVDDMGKPILEFISTSGGGGGTVSSVQCVGNVLYVTYGS